MIEMQLVMMHHGTSLRFSLIFIQNIDSTLKLSPVSVMEFKNKVICAHTFKFNQVQPLLF